ELLAEHHTGFIAIDTNAYRGNARLQEDLRLVARLFRARLGTRRKRDVIHRRIPPVPARQDPGAATLLAQDFSEPQHARRLARAAHHDIAHTDHRDIQRAALRELLPLPASRAPLPRTR